MGMDTEEKTKWFKVGFDEGFARRPFKNKASSSISCFRLYSADFGFCKICEDMLDKLKQRLFDELGEEE